MKDSVKGQTNITGGTYAGVSGCASSGGSGFEVREQQGERSSLTFSWRVMVKAKSSVKQERLGKFTMPNIPLPDAAKLPKPPEVPEVKKK